MSLQNFKENLFIIMGCLSAFVCLLILILSGLAAWWAYAPVNYPITILNPKEHSAVQLDNNYIVIKREFIITRSVDIVVQREMVQVKPNGTLIKVDLPNLNISYVPGSYKTERLLEIPSSIFGKFELRNKACWHTNPIKVDCIYLPTLLINIDAK